MATTTQETLGGRIARLRARRRITQRGLADSAQVSVDLVRKLEQGVRHTARLDSLVRVANALDVSVAELLGKPQGLPGGGESQELLGLRQAILGVVTGPSGEPPTITELRTVIRDLWACYWTGRYAVLARQLPEALSDAHAAVRASDGQPAAHAVVAELHQIAASLLAHLACEDLAHVALMRATAAAEAADDELLRAAQQATRAWILARQGLWSDAERVSVETAAEIEPRFSTATPEQLAVWGELLRYGCTAVARAGRRAEAEEMLGMVNAAAAAIGDREPRLTGVIPFSPVIAGMAAVGIAVATDAPRRALTLAERVGRIDRAPLAIQARYLLNVAYAQAMDWRNQEATNTLRSAVDLAPEGIKHQTIARAIVAELLPRRRTQRIVGLSTVAEQIGVTG